MHYTDQDILEQNIDNSLIDRMDGNLPESDVDPTVSTPEYIERNAPGVDPDETDPTVENPEITVNSPSDLEGGE